MNLVLFQYIMLRYLPYQDTSGATDGVGAITAIRDAVQTLSAIAITQNKEQAALVARNDVLQVSVSDDFSVERFERVEVS